MLFVEERRIPVRASLSEAGSTLARGTFECVKAGELAGRRIRTVKAVATHPETVERTDAGTWRGTIVLDL